MEHRKIRRRGVQVTYRQKKKLIEFVSKNPQLISCKVTPEFNYRDSQRLWQTLANECNAIPGSKKTWRQWRKVCFFILINLNLPLCTFLDLTRMELVFPQEKHGCLVNKLTPIISSTKIPIIIYRLGKTFAQKLKNVRKLRECSHLHS